MSYPITIKKIKKFINPLAANILPNNDKAIDEKQIAQAITELDIFVLPDSDAHANHVRSIAYHALNSKDSKIHINVGFPEEGNTPDIMDASDMYKLAAAIYKKDETIDCELSGSSKALKALLGNEVEATDSSTIKHESMVKLTWDTSVMPVVNSWGDPTFVLEQITKHMASDSSNKIFPEHVFPYIDPALWEDKDFIIKASKTTKAIEHFPLDVLNSDWLLDHSLKSIKENKDFFITMWGSHYKNLYATEKSEDNEDFIDNPHLKNRIDDELFKNRDGYMSLLSISSSRYIPDDLLGQVDSSLLYDHDVLKKLHAYKKEHYFGFDLLSKLPSDFFESEKNTRFYLGKVDDYIYSMETHPQIYSSWLTNKELLLSYMKDYPKHFSESFITKVLKDQFKDIDIAKAVVHAQPRLYRTFPKKIRDNKDVLLTYIEYGQSHDWNGVNMDLVYAIDNKEHAILALKHDPRLIKNEKFPDQFKNDPEIWYELIDHWNSYSLPINKSMLNIIATDKNKCKQILYKHPDLYHKMPQEIKNDADIAYSYMLKMNDKEEYHIVSKAAQLPSHLKGNLDFCIKLLSLNKKLIEVVPQNFWYNSEFVLKVCKEIDGKQMSRHVFLNAPTDVKLFFDAFQITENYGDFMGKYILNQELQNDLKQQTKVVRRNKI